MELNFQGFTHSHNDASLFIKRNCHLMTIAAIYIDDIILSGNDVASIQSLNSHLYKTFSIKHLGVLHYFLGIKITYVPTSIILTQSMFTKVLLDFSGLCDHKTMVTSLPLNLKLNVTDGILYHDPTYYRSLIGKLNFLTLTRPDLALFSTLVS